MIAQMLPDLINQLLPMLITGVTQLTISIIEILPDLIVMIADILPTLFPQIIEAIMKIIPALIKNLPKFVSAGVKLIGGLVKGIANSGVKLVKGVGDLASKGINKLKETFAGKSPLEIGKMLVEGLWNGIKNVTSWILDKIKGFRCFEFVKSKPKTVQYFLTYSITREKLNMNLIENTLVQKFNGNEIRGTLLDGLGGTSVFRITKQADLTEQLNNRDIILQHYLFEKIVLGIILFLFVITLALAHRHQSSSRACG